jgi:hypothetical protein
VGCAKYGSIAGRLGHALFVRMRFVRIVQIIPDRSVANVGLHFPKFRNQPAFLVD